MTLEELRKNLSAVDRRLVELIAERQQIVSEIGKSKRDTGTGTRDYAREKEVLDMGRQQAGRLGIDPDLVEAILGQLIRTSLASQERDRVAAEGKGDIQPPDHLRERIKRTMTPLPSWYEPFESTLVDEAEYPLYALTQGAKKAYARDDAHKDELLQSEFTGRGKVEISRFKGLGEMMPAQLKETTMDPAKRTVLQVAIAGDDQKATAKVVDQLMGTKPEARFRFISENAEFATDELLDV